MQKTKKRNVTHWKVVRTTKLVQDGPQEVLVYDVLLKQKVVAVYRGENQQWYSQRLYKVYHPAFEGGHRLLPNIIRFLGPADEILN
jgi:hypothetical protein